MKTQVFIFKNSIEKSWTKNKSYVSYCRAKRLNTHKQNLCFYVVKKTIHKQLHKPQKNNKLSAT